MGPWDARVMILMGPRALGMGPIIDCFIHGKFYELSPWRSYLVADESILRFNGYMTQDAAISESLNLLMFKSKGY